MIKAPPLARGDGIWYYFPKKRGKTHGGVAHAISATDYAGGPRFLGRHINIGHFELPPPPGFMLMLK